MAWHGMVWRGELQSMQLCPDHRLGVSVSPHGIHTRVCSPRLCLHTITVATALAVHRSKLPCIAGLVRGLQEQGAPDSNSDPPGPVRENTTSPDP